MCYRRAGQPAWRLFVIAAATVMVPTSLSAEQSGVDRSVTREMTAEGVPVGRALRVEARPAIDGDVLGDPIWEDAVPVTGFRQTTPDEGQPASERTEIRITYDQDTLYFGVICYVQDPTTIIVSDSRRDTPLNETDSFQIIIDTYLDRQNGFVFGTNPAGLEYDGQLTNEGRGSGRFSGVGRARSGSQQRGSGGGFNLNWDGVWQVRAQVSEIGWTAEFAIPFRTLRYPSGASQIWGINFQRNIRNRNEEAFWAPLPRQFGLYRLSLAGELHGIEVPAQRNLKLTPYALGETLHRASDATTTTLGDVGADLKYSVTPSLTLDLTYNTDFAQVEVDEEQINLDRFNLFFPEKRPFFLENAGLFSVGLPGQVELFFSRRIGIGEDGEQTPIIGGGRLSGKIGNNTNIGFLNLQTESVIPTGTPANNFMVARVRQDFANRSNLGVMVVNRQATGSLAGTDDYNRSFAVDGRLGIGQGRDDLRVRRQNRHPGSQRRHTRLRPIEPVRDRALSPHPEFHRGGTKLQPGGGVLRATRLSAADDASLHVLPTRELSRATRGTPACEPLHHLELSHRPARDPVHPYGQPLGMAQRERGAHRGKPDEGRGAGGV